MNSEELETSLRTEFENYLKDVFAGVRQEIAQLQTKVETELENHKSQLDTVFKDALRRAESGVDLDAGFKDSVLEHMRLARDEGARITATAFAEAEDMNRQTAAAEPGIKELHRAVNEISSKDSQGEILKTLVHHAAKFAARGAFFIVKKEHFVAWRIFDGENDGSEDTVHEVFLPMSADSILSESVRSLSTVESNSETYSADSQMLEKLGFGAPEKTYAIPLVARGRGVAVLYVDRGANETGSINIEALETMVHVAGLTVEILASARGASKKKAEPNYAEQQSAKPAAQPAPAETAYAPAYESSVAAPVENTGSEYRQTSREPQNYAVETPASESGSTDPYANRSYSNEQSYAVEPTQTSENAVSHDYSDNYSNATEADDSSSVQMPAYQYTENAPSQAGEKYPTYEDNTWNKPAEPAAPAEENYPEPASHETNSWGSPEITPTPVISAQEYADNFVKEADTPVQNYSHEPAVETESKTDYSSDYQANQYGFEQPETTNSYEQPAYEPTPHSFEQMASETTQSFAPQTETYAPVAPEVNPVESQTANLWGNSAAPPAPPAATAPPAKSRLSERNVDLPIEVGEDERRLHNDARRFARLLVSEIKLYNEQKVKEGRDASDLYDRLREAIDRSREMYDKRVQPPVAAKFDYFHYELVNTLAEGDSNKLGADYPGAAV